MAYTWYATLLPGFDNYTEHLVAFSEGNFLFLYKFLASQQFISHNFLLCHPSQRSARSQVPSQVATHQKIGSQL
jgi:hypothetical protein